MNKHFQIVSVALAVTLIVGGIIVSRKNPQLTQDIANTKSSYAQSAPAPTPDNTFEKLVNFVTRTRTAITLRAGDAQTIKCSAAMLAHKKISDKEYQLVCGNLPTSAPTPTIVPNTSPIVTAKPVVTPVVTTTPQTNTGGTVLSHAMGMWDPASTTYTSSGALKYPKCTKALHDSYSVIGPDGKRYPTWHPPVVTDPSTGAKCTFGHEHGKDPSKYAYWNTIRQQFAFDANKNGIIEQSELETSGIPFGYVNEQMSVSNMGYMRHEDHVGHKIEYVNGELDTGGEDRFSNATTGGVVIPEKTNNTTGEKWRNSGISCYFFDKIHQGVHSPDAFTNNLHEAVMHSKCVSSRSDYKSNETLISGLIQFGAAGEFTKFCSNDRDTVISLGKDANNTNFPGTRGDGMRNIMTRDCVEQTLLVPSGQFSGFPYEIWSGDIEIRTSAGRLITATTGGGWEVLDAIRYYDPNATNKIRYNADLCSENFNGRMFRGGSCSWSQGGWKDARSAFRGLQRGQYMGAPNIANASGSPVYYTDVYGRNASATPFTGSIKQIISAVDTKINFDADPRNILRWHDDGEGTVHAPN